MLTIEEKRLQFLNDTIAHYNLNNRCVDDKGNCSYYSQDKTKSTGCAIGKHLDSELAQYLDSFPQASVIHGHIFKQLPENLKDLGARFLQKIQNLHDKGHYWNEYGLSESGQVMVNNIKKLFNL